MGDSASTKGVHQSAPATLPPSLSSFLLQRDRVDAGRAESLLRGFQVGRGSERAEPHAMPGLAVDVDRLHVGGEALQRELGLHAVGVGAARERADLQQVAAAGTAAARRGGAGVVGRRGLLLFQDRKSTRLNSSHPSISYAVFCLKKKKK